MKNQGQPWQGAFDLKQIDLNQIHPAMVVFDYMDSFFKGIRLGRTLKVPHASLLLTQVLVFLKK